MTNKPKYDSLFKNRNVRRWYENLRARSTVTASVYLRYLGHYCEIKETNPDALVEDAKGRKFRNDFEDFVRDLENKGKAGSYISKYKKVLKSWLKYNDLNTNLRVNIRGENETPTLNEERVPTREELAKILRSASTRGRVAIAIMAFSGLRPGSLGNYEGTDGIKLGDIKELRLTDRAEFEKVPSMIVVRRNINKARHQYFSFINQEGLTYIKEYVEERIKRGERITNESPLLQLDPRGVRKNSFLRTMLVTRDIREAIGNSNLKMRPYVLRSYFDTALDISESKGLISHPWRMFIMGHKGDIESRYSTNKRLPPEIIEEMREAYRRSEKYFSIETSNNEVNNLQLFVKKQVLLIAGYSQEDIDSMNIQEMTDDEITQKVKDRMVYSAKEALTRNGAGQILVRKGKVRDFLGKGFEFVADLNDGNVIMKMP